jgi:flagellar hook-basal body complex protein FliE
VNEFGIAPLSVMAATDTASVAAASAAWPDLAPVSSGADFADWLADGLQAVSTRMGSAQTLATRFALGADLPPHQVVLALEEARLSFQFALQIRNRLLEGYQDLMRMQL